MLLLLSYGIILPPIVLAVVVKDVKVKNEGYSIWHLDSLGLLTQRFIAALLILICLLIFESCADTPTNMGACIGRSLLPLLMPWLCVICKVFCLRSQRMLMWSGFLICVIAQIVILFCVKASFKHNYENRLGAVSAGVEVWLMFIPSMVFGLLIDAEALYQTWTHKPSVFKADPKYQRGVLIFIAVISLLASVSLIVVSFLAYTPLVTPLEFINWFFYCLLLKAVFWSPFIALEYYNLIFENIF